MTEPCTSFAPGRALPQGECERCHFQRHEHLLEHRSLPGGKVLQPEVAQGEVVPRLLVKPGVVYCRGCGAGLIIKPPTDPDTWPCPQCGHVGAKSGHPSVTAEQERAPWSPPESTVKYTADEVSALAPVRKGIEGRAKP